MISTHDIRAPKKATNLTINSDLLKKAKSYNINISQNFEAYLAEVVRKKEEQQWLEENLEAIDDFNEHVEKEGCFSDEHRRF